MEGKDEIGNWVTIVVSFNSACVSTALEVVMTHVIFLLVVCLFLPY